MALWVSLGLMLQQNSRLVSLASQKNCCVLSTMEFSAGRPHRNCIER